MSEKRVIIVGAGLAGLAAGCYAQMNGYQSHNLEHHSQPGGVAAAWRRGDYWIDGGIHFVMGHKPGTALHEMYRHLGIVPAIRFVDLTGYGRFSDEASGRSLEVGHDLDRLAADLKALFPADARLVDELIAGSRAMQGLDLSTAGLGKPPELVGRLEQLKELWSMRRLMRFMFGKYAQSVSRYARDVQDPLLKIFLESLFLPSSPLFFIFMLLGMAADGQLGLIDGTCLDLVRAIERRYRDLGGQVTYRATVEKILVENDRAVGVRLADGREHRAGAVIAACDGRSAIFQMLGGRYTTAQIEERYRTWPTFAPLLLVSFGVAREFPGEPAFGTVVLERPMRVGQEQVNGFFIRRFSYSRRFAPPGKSVIQVEFETTWDHWNDLQRQDRAAYEAEKQRVAAGVLDRLERHYPGLSSLVEVTDVSTPYTTWRYTLNHEGAWEGWLMTAEAMKTTVARTLPGLADFFMAGQWVMPGGGVPPVLYSGQHAVQLLCRRDGKSFVAAS